VNLDAESPSLPTLISPTGNEQDVSFDATLSWIDTQDSYNVELSTSSDFSQVFFSAQGIAENEVSVGEAVFRLHHHLLPEILPVVA